MIDKVNGIYIFVIYDDGEWRIELRNRNNHHDGEPDMKVWVLRSGREVAQFTNSYRGYGRYKNDPALLPSAIIARAEKAWKDLSSGYYTEEKLERMLKRFKESSMVSTSEACPI